MTTSHAGPIFSVLVWCVEWRDFWMTTLHTPAPEHRFHSYQKYPAIRGIFREIKSSSSGILHSVNLHVLPQFILLGVFIDRVSGIGVYYKLKLAIFGVVEFAY